MVGLLADENFDHRILRGLLLQRPALDVVIAQEVGLFRSPDPMVLEWAAGRGRVVLTHDIKTMPGFAYERIGRGQPLSGLITVNEQLAIGRAIDEILIALDCTRDEEWPDLVVQLPL
jgi:uncharacterized protein DUF5615